MALSLAPSPRDITFRPKGLSDALDATNVFAGAMQQLINLVPDPAQDMSWVCRPAAEKLTGFAGFSVPGFVSGLLVVGNIAYGTIASSLHSGKDQPFAYNLSSGAFLTVNGITAGNVPTSPATTGDWTPPILAQVGSRVIVTHPGFPGSAVKFGWFDVSGFSESTTGNTNTSTIITGNPTILGVQPGMTVASNGADLPAGVTVVSTANVVLDVTGDTHTNMTVDNISPGTTGMAVGQVITGTGIPAGTTIAAVTSGSAITLSQAATAGATVPLVVTGATITLSAAATGSNNGDTLTIAGGTAAAPLWGAGDTDRNNLPSVPVGVAQFNGRAYYALGVNGIVFSDSGFPCRVSNNPSVQALTPADGGAITAIGPLGLNTLLGGIVQGLIAFEGVSKLQQITGDPTTSNLAMNALPAQTGTQAPLSVVPFELGLAFVSPEGLRWVDFSGRVSPPLGDHGTGICVPFIFALHPSRICVAANVDTIRISVINGNLTETPTQEYCWDIARKAWHGPHTFPASLIQPWGDTYVVAPAGLPATLFQSDISPSLSSTFTENGMALTWNYEPSLLPDTGSMSMNTMIETNIALALPAGATVNIYLQNESGQVLDTSTLTSSATATIWGNFTWGNAVWGGGTQPPYQQRRVYWNYPFVFKQASILFSGPSAYNLRISNLYMQYQELGYNLLVA